MDRQAKRIDGQLEVCGGDGAARRAVCLLAAAALYLAPAAPATARTAADAAQASPARYALVVNGDDSFTHDKNVELALTTLPRLGYAAGDTYALAPVAVAGACSGCRAVLGAGSVWQAEATDGNLRRALALLGRRMHAGDTLLVYLTGHGYRAFGRPVLALSGRGTISAADLVHRLAELPFGRLILIADQCYSGGFAKAALALGRNVVAVSSTDDSHEVRCEPFVRPFWMAALGADGATPVAVEEAFRVAAGAVRRAEVDKAAAPQIAASGSCAGHDNSFAAPALTGTGSTRADAATEAPAPASPGRRR